jgi:hypothetical protein
VIKCASHAVETRLGRACLMFSPVSSDCQVHALGGSMLMLVSMLASVATACVEGSTMKSGVGLHPKNGSGWAMRDFLWWVDAALAVRL